MNYNIIDPFPDRGDIFLRDDAPKSLNEMQREEAARKSRDRSKSLINNLLSIFK